MQPGYRSLGSFASPYRNKSQRFRRAPFTFFLEEIYERHRSMPLALLAGKSGAPVELSVPPHQGNRALTFEEETQHFAHFLMRPSPAVTKHISFGFVIEYL